MNNTNRYNSNNMTSNRQNINGSYQVSFFDTWNMCQALFSVESIKSGYDESCSSRPEASWYTIIKSNSETEASYACTKKYSTCTGQRRQGKIHFYPQFHDENDHFAEIPNSWTLLATRSDLERPILTKNKSLKKFPVVTHKEIQVEIVPSELAKKNNDIEYYEIEFKGRKTPNKYNVKPNIKIVKLIGLQSDTRYLIKVFAVRNSSKYLIYPQIKSEFTPQSNLNLHRVELEFTPYRTSNATRTYPRIELESTRSQNLLPEFTLIQIRVPYIKPLPIFYILPLI